MRKLYLLFLSSFLFTCIQSFSQISLSGPAYTQDFNTLSSTAGSTTNNLTIPGWLLTESGGGARDNEQYAVDAGTSNTGDMYSYGAAASAERALGSLRSGTLIPVFGAFFTNNTGATLTSLTLSYTGEQWRLGTAARTDRLDFQYSLNATSLVTGTWVDVDALDFTTPNTVTTGAKDGNTAPNQTAIASTITGLSIPNGATFYIRWNDVDASGADDGLAIDDFTVAATGGSGPLTITTSSPLTNGTVGNAYNQTISASGGTSPYSFIVSAGTLPTGTTLAASGAITGTPTASGTFNFTVDATDAAPATVSKAFAITIINAPCSPPTHTIAEIQGAGNLSPLVGNAETTNGIVTGIRSNGFFMQTPDASADADPNTSEGIFVFTSSAPPPAVVIGNNVCVTGTIAEFIPSTDPNSPAQTEIVSPSVTVLSTGNPLPAAIVLTAANTNPAGSLYQLERFEGMRVQVNSMTVVAPTQGNKTESAATSVSNGFFYGVITGVARPFREAGVAQSDPLPPGAPVTVIRWDANPELIGVGSNSIGGVAIDVATGAILTNVVGPLDYRSRAYTIDIDPAFPPVVSNNGLTFTAIPAQTSDELTVATFNIERFYDDINDPNGDAVLTTTAYNNRLNKVSLAIRNVLRTPDILCVVEVEKLSVLQAIATKVNADALAAGNPDPNYQAYLAEGNDVGGIDVGFLVKSLRVNVTGVTQFGLTTTYINPTTGLPELLNDRPPLVLNGIFTKPGCTTSDAITVIVNHLRSLNGIDDVGANGIRVRAKRQAQAEFLANLIQGFQTTDPTANIISVGDYNAFEFSDGYVDMIGTIKGTPAPASVVVVASPDLVNPDLTDLADAHPAAQRYSYSFSGSAQVLDHILVNSNLASKISRFSIARVDADFPEVYRTDANRPERISDHDAPVAYILFTDNIAPVITCPANITVGNTAGQCGATVIYPAPTTTDNCSGVTITSVPASGSLFPLGITTVTSTATDASGNTATCTFTITVNDIQPPTITCPANITRSNDAGQCSAVVAYTTPAATDNCPGVTVSRTAGPASGSVFPVGITTITHTATDASGNTATCSFTVTVNDIQPPVITCPANITVSNTVNQCGAIVNFTPVASDNCPIGTTTAVTINQSSSATITAGSVSCNAGGLHTDNSYWRAYDLAPLALVGPYTINTVRFGIETANASGVGTTQPVNVRIYTQTTGTFPGGTRTLVRNQTFNIPDQAAAIFSANLTSPVTVPANSVVILELNTPDGQAAGHSFFIGSNAAAETGPSYLSAAACGVNVPTTTAAIGFPNMHILLSAAGTVPVPGSGTVSVPASGSFFPVGTTTVTSTATDGAGNTASCSFTVRVNDTQAPVITCPANITVTTATGLCTAPVTYAITATDNCPGVTTALTAGLASGASFPIGVTTVTHRATDAAGNITSCSFTVTVLDGQLPVISAQPANRTVCTGTNAAFSVTSSNALSYQWQQFIGGVWTNIAGQTGSSLTLNAVNVGMNDNSYRVNVIGFCSTVSSGFASLYVNPLPSVSLTASNPPVLLPTQTTSIVANVNPTGGTFAWFKNGAALSPAVTIGTLSNLAVENVGTYRTVYTDLNGCVNTSGDLVISAEPSERLYVAPNPNFGQFWVRYYNQVNEQLTLIVFNSNGARVYQKSVTTTVAYSRIDVDLGVEAPGTYVVELRNSAGKLLGSKKMIVSHR